MNDYVNTRQKDHRQALALPGGQLVEVAGVQLWVVDGGGRSPAILCLHAAGQGSRDFELLIDRARSRYRIITVDWPAHGNSGDDPQAPDAHRYAELIEGLLDTLSLSRVVLLGCSVGGAAATLVAARRPDRVEGLVLCNAGGFATPSIVVRGFTGLMSAMYDRGAHGAWWFPAAFGLIYRALLRGPDARAQQQRIIAAGREHAAILSQLWASFGKPVNDVRQAAASIQCPVWRAWAKSDPFNNYWMIRSGLALLPGELRFFKGGHAPFLEQPDAFFAGFEVFIQQLGGTDGADDAQAHEATVMGARQTRSVGSLPMPRG